MMSFIRSLQKILKIMMDEQSFSSSKSKLFRRVFCHERNKGFTLLEIILVIVIIASTYVIVIPSSGIGFSTSVMNKISRLTGDIRSAFDMAVLKQKYYRLVFRFSSGDYWLEESDRPMRFQSMEKLGRDPTPEEEQEQIVALEEMMREYEVLAGETITTADNVKIKPYSPLLLAKERLRPAVWEKVVSDGWGIRELSPSLIIQDMSVEHLGNKVSLSEHGREAFAMIYIRPQGYIEQAVIHLVHGENGRIDEGKKPYTLLTNPYQGTATIINGYHEIDVYQKKKS